MPAVTVIATGGTIASARGPGGAVPTRTAGELLGGSPAPGVQVRVVELMAKDSSSMTFADMDRLGGAVAAALADPAVAGVVVLHGTDTLEESALLVDLWLDDPRPVVFTGAQRPSDHPDPDGPRNLRDALAAAADPGWRGRGVLVVFGGHAHPVHGTRKQHTTALDAFGPADPSPLLGARLALPRAPVAGVRVDIVAAYPGADRTQVDACVAAGARGLVLEAMGSGNANALVVAAVADAVAAGVAVVVTTRVPAGPAEPVYGGGGGGVDLRRAGAVFSAGLRSGQARVLLAALLACRATPGQVEGAFTAR